MSKKNYGLIIFFSLLCVITLLSFAMADSTQIFNNYNIGGVGNGPSDNTQFTISTSYMITDISDYHWNYGRGATLGTIKLVDSNGKVYGPWKTTGVDGQGGVKNASWKCKPNIILPPGTYTVIDSEPSTWSCNSESGNAGFTMINGNESNSDTTSDSGETIKIRNCLIKEDGQLKYRDTDTYTPSKSSDIKYMVITNVTINEDPDDIKCFKIYFSKITDGIQSHIDSTNNGRIDNICKALLPSDQMRKYTVVDVSGGIGISIEYEGQWPNSSKERNRFHYIDCIVTLQELEYYKSVNHLN